MRNFYHISPIDHPIGAVLQPGAFGRLYRQFNHGGQIAPGSANVFYDLTWEAVLETARVLVAAHQPSRLNCIYACTTLAAAEAFRNAFRAGGAIFEIAVADEVPIFQGDLASLGSAKAGEPFLDVWVRVATRYWTDQPPGVTEVLIGGSATILAKV